MLHLWNKRFNYSALKRVTDKSGARHYSLDGNKVPSVTTILEKTKAQKDIDQVKQNQKLQQRKDNETKTTNRRKK